MQQPTVRLRRLVVLMVSLAALTGCAWLDTKQRALVLRPTPNRSVALADDATLLRPGDERYKLSVYSSTFKADGLPPQQALAIWWLPHPRTDAPTLLYLHGTFRNLYQNLPKINALRDAGFAVLAVDYRGWGDSSPIVPSEASIHSDVLLAWGELVMRQPQAGRRVVYGHSMGGAAAIALASQLRQGTDYGALIVESTFTRLPDVAAESGFWGRVAAMFSTLEFDSFSKIGQVDAPILMLHGSDDKTVPVQLGRRLRDAAPTGVRWMEFAGGSHSRLHSEAPVLYRETLRQFIADLESKPPDQAVRP